MRILIGGSSSGCGKTTMTLALLRAMKRRGRRVAAFKLGPDYIDPGFHEIACGEGSDNLDGHLMKESALLSLLGRRERQSDGAVIEGVMGYYDGLDALSLRYSSYDLARRSATPTLLVVDASGSAASVAATVKGFQTFLGEKSDQNAGIAAVLVNRVSSPRHFRLVEEAIEHYCALPSLGCLPRDESIQLSSRSLGLIPASEVQGLEAMLDKMAAQLEESLNWQALDEIGGRAADLPDAEEEFPAGAPFRLGVAHDAAFQFYYKENFRLMRKNAMQLEFFSPIHDRELPQALDGLYLGGGFPELFLAELSENRGMLGSIRAALEAGMPCYAEGGGLLYLSQSLEGVAMVGFLPLRCCLSRRLQQFGYVHVHGGQGLDFPAHSFHRSVGEPTGAIETRWRVEKTGNPSLNWREGYARGGTLATFLHRHFAHDPRQIRSIWQCES